MPNDFAPGLVPAASAPLFSGTALLDAEKLDAYRIALEFQAMACQLVPKRGYSELRDQLDRASISIVLNTAEAVAVRRPLIRPASTQWLVGQPPSPRPSSTCYGPEVSSMRGCARALALCSSASSRC